MKRNIRQGRTAKNFHNTLSDCEYIFLKVSFLILIVLETGEQLKRNTSIYLLHL